MPRRVDALIVGGGPAGAMSALLLARRGWRVMLVERGERHRDKACGHCLNARAVALLAEHGLHEKVRATAPGSSARFRAHFGQVRLELPARGLLIERSCFDQLLMDEAAAAGATIVQPGIAKVVDPSRAVVDVRAGNRSECESIEASLVIGADGVGSGIARAAGLVEPRRVGRKFGFAFDLASPAADAIEPATISMFVERWGYLGIVNRGGGMLHIAGLVGDGECRDPIAFTSALAAQHELMRRVGLDRVSRAQVTRMAAAGPMPWSPRRVAKAGVALVGDAAGYVEPFTGEGMSWALQSAMLLCEIVRSTRRGQWSDRLANRYQRAWSDLMSRQQGLCKAVAVALRRPRLTRMLAWVGATHPAIAERVAARLVSA